MIPIEDLTDVTLAIEDTGEDDEDDDYDDELNDDYDDYDYVDNCYLFPPPSSPPPLSLVTLLLSKWGKNMIIWKYF